MMDRKFHDVSALELSAELGRNRQGWNTQNCSKPSLLWVSGLGSQKLWGTSDLVAKLESAGVLIQPIKLFPPNQAYLLHT